MDYKRYSKQALDALPPNELRRRLAELAIDVKAELHATVAAKLEEIAAALNAGGHELRDQVSTELGHVDFAQGEKPNPFYLCCDAVISSGYKGCNVSDASIEDQMQWEAEWKRAQKKEPNQPPQTTRAFGPRV